MSFQFKTKNINSKIVFTLSGNLLDKEAATELIEKFEEKVNSNHLYFIFDLEKMNYLNSTGLNVLIGLLTKVRNSGGEMIICNVSSKINQLLLITKLNTVFNVSTSLDEAIKMIENEITNSDN